MELITIYRSDNEKINLMGPWAKEENVAYVFGMEQGYNFLYIMIISVEEFNENFKASGYGFIPIRKYGYVKLQRKPIS